jgi:transcriptional regulator with PAS, ATPase and Fis domain
MGDFENFESRKYYYKMPVYPQYQCIACGFDFKIAEAPESFTGFIFLFGEDEGYVGAYCPQCKKTILEKKDIYEVIKFKSSLLIYNSTITYPPTISHFAYRSFPLSIFKPHEIGIKYKGSFISGDDKQSYISENDTIIIFRKPGYLFGPHMDEEEFYRLHEPIEAPINHYCTCEAFDKVLGSSYAIYGLDDESIKKLIDIENIYNVNILPRYVPFDKLTSDIDTFACPHESAISYNDGIVDSALHKRILFLSILNIEIRNDVYLSKIAEDDLATWPKNFLRYYNNLYSNNIALNNIKRGEISDKIWKNIRLERVQKLLDVLLDQFIKDYIDLILKRDYTYPDIWSLKESYLEKLYTAAQSNNQFRHIENEATLKQLARIEELEKKFPSLKKIVSKDYDVNKLKEELCKLCAIKMPNISLLLIGETGTGKELFAKAFHEASGCKGEFVSVNCAAIAKTLFEAEMFGSKKGSYTNSNTDRKGFLEQADGGTLFLDEIGDLPFEHQPKLLRALEDKMIRPVGSEKQHKVDFNLVCATNKDLPRMAEEDTFRKDLYFRINTQIFIIPPLSKRIGDIQLLLDHLTLENKSSLSDKLCVSNISFSKESIKLLKNHKWIGNIRELNNMVKKLLIKLQMENEPDNYVVQPIDLSMLLNSPKDKATSKKLKIIDLMKDILYEVDSQGKSISETAKKYGVTREHLSREINKARKAKSNSMPSK